MTEPDDAAPDGPVDDIAAEPSTAAGDNDDTAEVESNTIEVAVYGLRRKLGAGLIATARGLGYTIPKGA